MVCVCVLCKVCVYIVGFLCACVMCVCVSSVYDVKSCVGVG